MHELSLSHSLVRCIEESLEASLSDRPALAVRRVHLAIGELSGVAIPALEFSFPIAAAGTLAAGATLVIRSVPVRVYCPHCDCDSELEDIQRFRCRHCGQPTAQVRSGREMEIESLEIEVEEAYAYANSGTASQPFESER